MSVAVKVGRSRPKSKCVARVWKLFPHLFLCLSLVAYAALGALLFEQIEGNGNSSTLQPDYDKFLGKIVVTIQNLTQNVSYTHVELVGEVKNQMRTGFKSIWLQEPQRWTFFGSMFFCCTVFTTVGYGEIYPVTFPGKVVCVLYAMVGIPLMLLVISDVGDLLAVLLSRVYLHFHTLCKSLCYRSWSPRKTQKKAGDSSQRALEDGTFVFSHDVVVREPIDIRQVLHSQADVKQKSIQLSHNTEIFEKILTRENLLRQGPLLRSLSCPELDQMSPPPKGYAMWDFTGIGNGMEQLDVPFVLILIVVFAYILFGGLILPIWEKEFKGFDPFYFCFITLTTIGFGDIVPSHPKYFMLTSLFIITGMAIMSMAFKLGQSRIVSCYRQCIRFISGGNVETFEGYGEIYPVTFPGKVVCVLYAMVGIPLMLLVINDVGDLLAVLLSRVYLHFHTLCKSLCYRSWSPRKTQEKAGDSSQRALEDGTFVFSHDVVVREPIDIRQVLHSQADVKQKSIQLSHNTEIFEKILTRENLLRQGPLLRSLSCPELDQMSPPSKGYAMWDFTGIGNGMEQLDVPFVLILIVVFAYILFGGLILPIWEKEFKGFDPFYFCFITLTTIGFGDIVPSHPKYFMLTSLFIIITGMAIMSIAFKLGQSATLSAAIANASGSSAGEM